MRFYSLVAGVLLAAKLGHAQTTPAANLLPQVDKLVQEKKYESAYQLLDKADPKNQLPELLLRKEQLLLENYLMSVNHRMFALKDLKPAETIGQLRGKEGEYVMHALDLPLELNRLQRKFPNNYALAKGLGDYYYQVQMCHCGEQDKSDEQLLALALRYYSAAHAHGQGDYLSYFAVGYAQLRQDKIGPAMAALEKSVALNPKYPNSHYNLAYAFWLQKQPEQGIPHARIAYDGYTDEPKHRADVSRMLGMLYQQQNKPAEAQKAYQQSLALQPDDYPSLRGLLALAVPAHQPDAATLAARLYRLNPADDQMFNDIMDIYQGAEQWAEAEAFFQSQLPTAPKAPTAQGQLHFYLAILNMQLQRPKVARPHFLEAQKQLTKVVDPKNPLFAIIQKGLDETKP